MPKSRNRTVAKRYTRQNAQNGRLSNQKVGMGNGSRRGLIVDPEPNLSVLRACLSSRRARLSMFERAALLAEINHLTDTAQQLWILLKNLQDTLVRAALR